MLVTLRHDYNQNLLQNGNRRAITHDFKATQNPYLNYITTELQLHVFTGTGAYETTITNNNILCVYFSYNLLSAWFLVV